MRGGAPQLSQLALRLFSIFINAAGDERFFSQTGLTHSKLRNRLGHAKVTSIARVRAELNHDLNQARAKRARCAVATFKSTDGISTSGPEGDNAEPSDASLDEGALASAAEVDESIDIFMADWLDNTRLDVDDSIGQAVAAAAENAADAAASHVRTSMVSKAPLGTIITQLIGILDEEPEL